MADPGSTASAPTRLAVLHVDDSAVDLYRRRRILERAGFRVLDATSATAARRTFTAEHVDLVLVDVRLPDGTGFDLTRELKAEAVAAGRDVAVVLISTYFTEPEYRVRGLESGADAYFVEPMSDVELLASIEALARRLEQLHAARKNEQLLDALFEHIPDGIAVADAPDVKITRISRFGREQLGRSEDELKSLAASERPGTLGVLHSDATTAARAEDLPLTRAVTTGAVITNEEWVLRRADGRQITVLCNAGPIHDGTGRITGGVIAWRDITPRKEIENALTTLTEELTRADQAKNDFLATVVHELRQPISASLAALGVMKARRDRAGGERAREVIERQLHQISRIIDDLLDATRIVRGQVPLDLGPHDLSSILRRSVETVNAAAAERGLQLTADIPNDPVPVSCDASRLEQVFVNVLSNAVRYTRSGGVSVSVRTARGASTISIRDTGEGIPADRLPRIFDLFVRGTGSEGLGIGLAVARALIEAHGGAIEAHSEGAGKGSEFVVVLPMA